VVRTLAALGLPTTHPLLADAGSVIAGLEEFREHLGGRLTITLLRGIGSSVDVHEIDGEVLARAMEITAS
jgi:3-dehydroquinate synthase